VWGTAAAMHQQPDMSSGFRRAEIAQYVASLSNDLAQIAGASGLQVLEYLLKMIRLEAENLNQMEGN
jgi:hypothetical protein